MTESDSEGVPDLVESSDEETSHVIYSLKPSSKSKSCLQIKFSQVIKMSRQTGHNHNQNKSLDIKSEQGIKQVKISHQSKSW